MFSGSQALSVFPLWDPYRISFCPLSVLSDYSVACCCSMHFSPIWKQGAKAFSFEDSVLLGKEIFPQQSLTNFSLHLIRRYWFKQAPEKPGQGEWGWQGLGRAQCLP